MSNQTPVTLITRDMDKIAEVTGNVYESLYIIAKRARQIALKQKEEITNKLSEFSTGVDNLEEVHENREQIEISRNFERQPKPTALAIEEFHEGKIHYRKQDPLELPEGI